MSFFTIQEQAEIWRRLHTEHPYGPTAQLCHQERSISFVAEEGHMVGMHNEANRAAMVRRLINRKLVVTTTTAQRILNK